MRGRLRSCAALAAILTGAGPVAALDLRDLPAIPGPVSFTSKKAHCRSR